MDKYNERLHMRLPLKNGFFELKNPVLTASGTFGYGLEFTPFGDLATLGGIISKGLSLKPRSGNPLPRIAETDSGMLNAVGLQNCGVEIFLRDYLPKLELYNTKIIANIYADNLDDFSTLAEILSGSNGIAAIEVNISCPNVAQGGVLFGQSPIAAAKVTAAVKKTAGDTPIIIKLSPNVTDIGEIAKACADAGADMLSCINTITGMAVDLHSRKPLLANITGGLSGPAIKPVALRCVWQVAQAVDIPVIGIGGVSSPEDVLEFILAGAYAVQVGMANFSQPDIAFKIAAGLPAVMDKYGISRCAFLRGTLQTS